MCSLISRVRNQEQMEGLFESQQISFLKKITYVTYKLDLKGVRNYATKLKKEKMN